METRIALRWGNDGQMAAYRSICIKFLKHTHITWFENISFRVSLIYFFEQGHSTHESLLLTSLWRWSKQLNCLLISMLRSVIENISLYSLVLGKILGKLSRGCLDETFWMNNLNNNPRPAPDYLTLVKPSVFGLSFRDNFNHYLISSQKITEWKIELPETLKWSSLFVCLWLKQQLKR